MNIRKSFLVQLLVFALSSAIAMAQKPGGVQATRQGYVPGEVIVRFGDKVHPAVKQANNRVSFGVAGFDAVAQQFNCIGAQRINVTKRNGKSNYTYVIRYTAQVDPNTVIKALMATGVLKYAEPDYLTSAETTTPNDAFFNLQWSLYNTGTFPYSSPVVAGADMSMREAWDITQGSSSVTVAVIDVGAKLDHPEFAGRIWNNAGEIPGNGIDDDGNGYIDDYRGWDFVSDDNNPTDDHGHGTNVAGIIGANGNNGIGFAGVDWNCKLMILKALNSAGSGSYSDIISAINYATDNGAKVINMSLGGSGSSSAMQDAIDDAYAAGVNVVAAMGNNNSSVPSYPGACDHVIAVGATTAADRRASYSNYGSHITVVAPGSVIYGLWYLSNTDYTHAMSGTSMATPAVAGVVALLLAQSSTRTPDQIKAILQTTSDDMVGLASEDVAGWDQYYGYGRVNAFRALTNCVTPSPGTISGAGQVCASATITLTDTATGGTWSSSNTSVATVNSSGVVTGIAQGSATISFSKSNSCGTAFVTKQVRVNIPPAAISGASAVCEGYSITLSNTSGGGTWTTSDPAIATVGTATGVVSAAASGTAIISYTTGCGSDAGKIVTVNLTPSVISGSAAVCLGTSTTLSNTTPGGTWSSSNTGVATVGSATGIVTGMALGTVNINYIISSGCQATRQVTVVSPSAISVAYVPASGLLGWYPFNGNANNSLGTGLDGTVSGATLTTDRFGVPNAAYSFDGNTNNITIDTAFFNVGWSGYTVSCWFNSNVLDNLTNYNHAQAFINTIPHNGMAVYFGWGGSHHYQMFANTNPPVFGWDIMSHQWSHAPSTINVWKHMAMVKKSDYQYTLYIDGIKDTTFVGASAASNYYCKMVLGRSDPGIISEGFSGKLDDYGIWNRSLSDSEVYRLYAGAPLTAMVCEGATLPLTNATPGGSWSSSNTSVATVGTADGIVTGISGGTSEISYTVGGCTVSIVVTVNASGVAAITGIDTLCAGATTSLSDSTPGGTWSSSNNSIATVGSATGVVNGISAGVAAITYRVSGGCAAAYKTVTVNGAPSIGSITGASSFCAGNATTLSNSTPGGTWSSSNTAVASVGSASGIVSGVTAGNATITYAVPVGCGVATATKVVTVNAAPSVGVITGTALVCIGATTTLGNTVAGGAWSSSDLSVATVNSSTGVVTGVSSGNATITYAKSSACGTATATKVVTVSAMAAISGTLELCTGITSTLTSAVSGGTWSSSNPSVAPIDASTGVVTGASVGTAIITYSLGAGCTSSAIVTVSMPAIIAGTSNTCVGQTATLTDATAGGVWSSSNTALATVDATTGVVTGVAAGTPTISYIVSTGCYRVIAFTVKALPPAIAGPVTVCQGNTVYVAPPSTTGQSWTSSNTSVAVIGSSTGMLTGVSTGTTTLTYNTITGCYVTIEATVTAAPAAITGTIALCAGGISSLSNATSGGAWSSSNTSVASIGSATGVVTAGSTGTATVSYSIGSCRATAIVTVSPIAAITGTPNMCAGSSVALSDASAGGTWSSSNTAIATVGTSGTVTGVTAGNATITYTIASGCSRTITATVVAAPGPITGTLSLCPGVTTTLSGGIPGGSWSGGNASIATVSSSTGVVTGVGAGTINVSYTLTGCRVTAIATVNPLPAIITGTTNACVAQTSTLNSATSGGAWSSNNTAIATVDPFTGVVTGVAAATTTVTYTLGTGCYRTTTFTVKALPAPIAPVAACVGTSINIPPPSNNGRSWSSSTTTVATIGSSTGTMTGVSIGTTILTYTTTTGCFVTTEATVYALPSAGTIGGPTTVIISNTITLSDAAGGGVWSSSNTAKATIGAATGIVTGVAAGSTTISYSVSNPGCTVRTTQVVSVTASRPGGNDQFAAGSLQLYPNPTTGAFTVEAAGAGTFNVFSLDGREVSRYDIASGSNQLILPKELASGVYMCRYTSESGNTTIVRLVYER